MKLKNIFLIIIVNSFLVCAVSIYQQYLELENTFKGLDSTIDLAVDSAVKSSMASEELFSDVFSSEVTSTAHSYNDKDVYLYSKLKVLRGNKWVEGNVYIMSMYYNSNGHFPNTQTEYNSYASGKNLDSIYCWLYGDSGLDINYYNSASLNWMNGSSGLVDYSTIDSSSQQPTSNFLNFYNSVGKEICNSTTCFSKSGDSFLIENKNLPVLLRMGLNLDSDYNSTLSTLTNFDYQDVKHKGKMNSTYYLTPYSLGVTYIPTEVLKPAILSNLEQLIRFGKCKRTVLDNNDNSTYASADGCIDTNVYDNSSISDEHSYTSNTHSYITNSNGNGNTDMLNDGRVEYDMSSLQVKVDYFALDLLDLSNYKIVNYLKGAVPYQSNLTTTTSSLKDLNTDKSESTNKCIVAKVTVKIKIHIPYTSPVMQWFIKRTNTSANNHFDIKLWNANSDTMDSTSDGVWYQYSTYTAITD